MLIALVEEDISLPFCVALPENVTPKDIRVVSSNAKEYVHKNVPMTLGTNDAVPVVCVHVEIDALVLNVMS